MKMGSKNTFFLLFLCISLAILLFTSQISAGSTDNNSEGNEKGQGVQSYSHEKEKSYKHKYDQRHDKSHKHEYEHGYHKGYKHKYEQGHDKGHGRDYEHGYQYQHGHRDGDGKYGYKYGYEKWT